MLSHNTPTPLREPNVFCLHVFRFCFEVGLTRVVKTLAWLLSLLVSRLDCSVVCVVRWWRWRKTYATFERRTYAHAHRVHPSTSEWRLAPPKDAQPIANHTSSAHRATQHDADEQQCTAAATTHTRPLLHSRNQIYASLCSSLVKQFSYSIFEDVYHFCKALEFTKL